RRCSPFRRHCHYCYPPTPSLRALPCRSPYDRGRCPPAFDVPTLDVDAVPRYAGTPHSSSQADIDAHKRQKNSTVCRHIAQAFLPLWPKTRPAFPNR
ncbi:hypothetical protein C8R44DRAFT_796554, partial [Mycena epipterygia]